jgi:hypothetical protein
MVGDVFIRKRESRKPRIIYKVHFTEVANNILVSVLDGRPHTLDKVCRIYIDRP